MSCCHSNITYFLFFIALNNRKCKACNSLFAPKPVDQSSSKQSSNDLTQVSFNLEFSESENEADNVNEDNGIDSFTEKSTVDLKLAKDKRFLLEFSDSEDSDNEAAQETTSFTGIKEKISLGRLSDKEKNKQKKRAFEPLSDSEEEENDGDDKEESLTNKNKRKKRAFNPLSDSEEANDDDDDDDDYLPSINKQKKNRAFKPLSDSEYEDNDEALSETEYEDHEEVLSEAEMNKRRYGALFDSEEDSESEASARNKYKKIINNSGEKKKGPMPKFDADLLTKNIETYKQPGDLDKKRQKLAAVPVIKLDENGNPVKKKRGKYRFAPKPGNKFNPYILFNKEFRPKIKQANPGLDNIEINLLVGKAYRELDPEKKEKLIENSRKLAEQYKNSDGLPSEEKKNMGLKKLPPNGFILFKETNKDKYENEFKEGMTTNKYLTELWKRLPESERETYREESKNRRQEFMINHPIILEDLGNANVSLYNFARKRQDKYSKAPILALEDLDRTEIKENFLPFSRCSDLEHRCYTGHPKWRPSKFVDSTLDPLVVFGDGMKHKDAVRLKKRLSRVTNILYKEVICRQKQNLVAIVDINEFRTSVISLF
ncbi:hypothetical protein INT48_004735 [Thamnidium elegans]|uniref:HMG box domain-containing protein n=1 Tax=Thamnidium elegans TaxID=101142 RepID=A0A8H7W0B7_9FUNG|nr:hypothetical protein INT48_004735 [Thamnidium elegans]